MANAVKEKFLRFGTVADLVGLSRTTIWRLEKEGSFPKRIRLGTNTIAWRELEISEWMDLKISLRA